MFARLEYDALLFLDERVTGGVWKDRAESSLTWVKGLENWGEEALYLKLVEVPLFVFELLLCGW